MKKLAIASAIALASITAAHAAPQVYGKAFLTADYVDTSYDSDYRASATATRAPEDDSVFKLNSNASRIGFKGSEELTDTTNLVYQLEYGISSVCRFYYAHQEIFLRYGMWLFLCRIYLLEAAGLSPRFCQGRFLYHQWQ